MRVNARLDETTQQQLDYLTQATGQSVSQVVRESVAQYFVQVQRQQAPSRFLARAGQWRGARQASAPVPETRALDVKSGMLDALRDKYPQHFGPRSAPATHAAPAASPAATATPRPAEKARKQPRP